LDEGRVPTGIDGFDDLIGGGFQRRGLIIVAGSPGTGKTVFGATFLCKGVELGEAGVYVSFAEDRETFARNMSVHLGRRFEECLRKGKCSFLDLVTMKEKGVSPILESILAEVRRVKARRLVIDSFSAMVQAFKDPADLRVVLHSIFYRMVRQLDCTTLLVVEAPADGESLGAEKFVADGVIILRRLRFDERDVREIEVAKLRGTEIRRSTHLFTLYKGFRVFPPFEAKEIGEMRSFQSTPDSPTHFSTGDPQLDKVLGGGYRRGSYVLVDVGEGVPYEAYRLLMRPTMLNFLLHGRGVTLYPSSGVDPVRVRKSLISHTSEDVVNRLARFYVRKPWGVRKSEPGFVEYEGVSLEKDAALRLSSRLELEGTTGQPSLSVWGRDDYEATYGAEVRRVFTRAIAEDMSRGGLNIDICKPAVRDPQPFRDVATYHFKVRMVDGAVLVHLVKPFSIAYCLEDDVSKGYHLPRLTPMV
jgi:KaiC/GvpD/RAD55 family RecA-like ATPase